MSENVLFLLIGMNLMLFLGLFAAIVKKIGRPKIEVQYFENIEDIEGAVSDSKRVTINGQLFLDGVPVGGQYLVAEKTIKKFDYEKLKSFKHEILEPIAKAGYYIGTANKRGLLKVISFFSKAG